MSVSPGALVARRLLAAASASAEHDGGARTWKILSFVVAFPGVAVCMFNAYLKGEHENDSDFVPYSHLRIRTKKFPWGDGNHSLFHNPHANPLPGGFEGSDH
ncbi:cytochrome c oxidase subunit 6A2, mitochondrial [Eucyclogobius newberryi]|uniref:cytochrome c oxidase subunit 6A2, mitochondrial n=1 Tax=Eucyclogobius newberryi TaxID=166745 RepID=UPI003B59AA7E